MRGAVGSKPIVTFAIAVLAAVFAFGAVAVVADDAVAAKKGKKGKKRKKFKTKTFRSGPVNLNFAGDSDLDEIVINKRGKIKDIDVGVRISHLDTSYLVVTLDNIRFDFWGGDLAVLTPDNGPIPNRDFGTGTCGSNARFTVFDADASARIGTAGTSSPFVGNFLPFNADWEPGEFPVTYATDDLQGRPLPGDYNLGVADGSDFELNGPPPSGVLHCWYMKIKYKVKRKKKKGKRSSAAQSAAARASSSVG